MSRCLFCLAPLETEQTDFHPKCSRSFFGSPKPPALPYRLEDLADLARQIVGRSIAVTGVQPKLSLAFEKNVAAGDRLTMVGLWGDFILKPPSPRFAELPENEHLVMLMAREMGLPTVPSSLIRLESGDFCYITRRIDRDENGKLPMEDFCQLTERLTEHKYRGSMEQVAKTVRRHSSNPGFDVLSLWELSVFCFLTGNADMHLKNFSMLTERDGTIKLTPAYDLVSSKLAMPEDDEESALTINGKKKKLKRSDFFAFGENAGLPRKAMENALSKFKKSLPAMTSLIDNSFFSEKNKADFQAIFDTRSQRLFIAD